MLLHLPAFALARLGRVARSGLKNAFAREELSARAHFALLCLSEYGELSQRELADHIAMDRSDLVKLLDELERSGLVRREPDPRDRRRRVLSITPAGGRTLSAGEDIIDQATEEVLKRLSPEQRAALHQLTLQALGALD